MYHYFYRCRRCFGLITRLQMLKALETGPTICACGSGTVGPTNPTNREWLKPAVLLMCLYKLLGKLEDAPESIPLPVPQAVRGVPSLSRDELVIGEDQEDVR